MNAIVKPEDLYLTVEQVAERYRVSTDSIWRWRRNGSFPSPVRVGPNCTRWRLSDMIEHEREFRACFAMSADWLLAA